MKFEEWLSQQNGVIEVDCGCVTTEAFYHWMRVSYEAGNSLVIPDEMTPEQAYEIGDYHGDPVDVFARGANWMRQHIIDSTLAAAPQSPGSEPATVPGKWIPVREQMPESKPGSYEYLVFETLNNRVNHDYWNAPDKGDDAFTPFWNYYGGHVTHWMPLPAAPQEVNGE